MAAKSNPDDLILRTVGGPQRFVNIDGVRYRIRRPEEFGLLEAQRLAEMQSRMWKFQRAKVTKHGLPALVKLLRDTVEFVAPEIPKAVLAKLGDGARMAIVNHFSAATRSPAASPTKTRGRRNGNGSPRDSNDSTAATRSVG